MASSSVIGNLSVTISGNTLPLANSLRTARSMIANFASSMPALEFKANASGIAKDLKANISSAFRGFSSGGGLPGIGDIFKLGTQGPGRLIELVGGVTEAAVKGVGAVVSLGSSVGSVISSAGDLIGGIARAAGGVVSYVGQITGEIIGAGLKTAGVLGLISLATIKLAADAEDTATSYRVLVGATGDYKEALAEIKQFAAETPFGSKELTDAGKQLLAYGTDVKQLVPALRTLGDVASATNTPIGDLTYLYGTLATQGKVFARDIYQFAGRGIPIQEELAKVLGVQKTQIMGLVEEGKIGFPAVVQAFKNMTTEGGRFYGLTTARSQTVNGLFSTLKDNVLLTAEAFGQVLIEELGVKDALRGLISGTDDIRTNIERWRPEIQQFAQYIKAAINAGVIAGKTLYAVIEQTVALAKDLFPNTFSGLQDGVNAIGQINYTMKDARLNALEFIKSLLEGGQAVAAVFERVGRQAELMALYAKEGALRGQLAAEFYTGNLDSAAAIRGEIDKVQTQRENIRILNDPAKLKGLIDDAFKAQNIGFESYAINERIASFGLQSRVGFPLGVYRTQRDMNAAQAAGIPLASSTFSDGSRFNDLGSKGVRRVVALQRDLAAEAPKLLAGVQKELQQQFGDNANNRDVQSYLKEWVDYLNQRAKTQNPNAQSLGFAGGFFDRALEQVQQRINELKTNPVEVRVNLVQGIIAQVEEAKKIMKRELAVPVETITGDQIKYIQGLQSEFDTVATLKKNIDLAQTNIAAGVKSGLLTDLQGKGLLAAQTGKLVRDAASSLGLGDPKLANAALEGTAEAASAIARYQLGGSVDPQAQMVDLLRALNEKAQRQAEIDAQILDATITQGIFQNMAINP